MDPIHTQALEPLSALLRPHPQASTPTTPSPEEAPGDTVTLSPEAQAALGSAAPVLPPEEPAPDDALGPEEDDTSATEEEAAAAAADEDQTGPLNLSAEEKTHVSKLRARDMEVRAHEAAHMSASGGLAGGASYTYQEGPDGKRYAIGGEVPISAPASRDPQQSLMNAERMRAAALAPASPSGQDRAVAARASAMAAQARAVLAEERIAPQEEDDASVDDDGAAEVPGTESPRSAGEAEGDEEPPVEAPRTSGYDTPLEPARLGGPAFSGPALHLHSDGCAYCSASAARFR